jgi:hypothetical protein
MQMRSIMKSMNGGLFLVFLPQSWKNMGRPYSAMVVAATGAGRLHRNGEEAQKSFGVNDIWSN